MAKHMESPASENIQLVRRVFEAFSERDIDAMLALAGAEIEF